MLTQFDSELEACLKHPTNWASRFCQRWLFVGPKSKLLCVTCFFGLFKGNWWWFYMGFNVCPFCGKARAPDHTRPTPGIDISKWTFMFFSCKALQSTRKSVGDPWFQTEAIWCDPVLQDRRLFPGDGQARFSRPEFQYQPFQVLWPCTVLILLSQNSSPMMHIITHLQFLGQPVGNQLGCILNNW